jgi:hypothetical protein
MIVRKYANLRDVATTYGDVVTQKIVEVLSKNNPILSDMPTKEGNLPDGNKSIIRVGLPKGQWIGLYEGVFPEKSERATVVDAVGTLADYSIVDKELAAMAPSEVEFIAQEDGAFISGMGQTVENSVFYGSKNGKDFAGLATRYNSLTQGRAKDYIINAGGTSGNLTSIYLVVWGMQTVYGFFPRNSKAGLTREYRGVVDCVMPNGGEKPAHKTWYNWQIGLTVADYRSVVRIANIPVDNLSSVNITQLLIQGVNKIKNKNLGQLIIYMPEAVKTALDVERAVKPNVNFSPVEWAGENIDGFRYNPIRISDSILTTESVVA